MVELVIAPLTVSIPRQQAFRTCYGNTRAQHANLLVLTLIGYYTLLETWPLTLL